MTLWLLCSFFRNKGACSCSFCWSLRKGDEKRVQRWNAMRTWMNCWGNILAMRKLWELFTMVVKESNTNKPTHVAVVVVDMMLLLLLLLLLLPLSRAWNIGLAVDATVGEVVFQDERNGTRFGRTVVVLVGQTFQRFDHHQEKNMVAGSEPSSVTPFIFLFFFSFSLLCQWPTNLQKDGCCYLYRIVLFFSSRFWV